MDARAAAAAVVFAATFLLLALGRIGRVPVPRGPAAVVGGLLTAALYSISWRAVDWDVMALLAGLMVLAGLAEAAGLFAGLRRRLARLDPALALWVSLLLVASASAILLNDAAVVVLVPFLLPTLRNRGLPLVPSVTLMAVAANVGSLLTPFGNPQNAALAHHADLGVLDFLRVQGPLVMVGLALLGAASLWVARRAVAVAEEPVPHAQPRGRPALALSIALFLGLAVVGPAHGIALGVAALAAAAVAYAALRGVVGGEADRAAWRGLDWNVLMLFAGLYMLTAGLPHWFPTDRFPLARLDTPLAALLGTSLLSNLVGNVPAILTFIRLDPAWATRHAPFLVTVSTLGGALLLTGSAASLLAADQARKSGVEVRFLPFLRNAVPWVLPLLVAGAWLTWPVAP